MAQVRKIRSLIRLTRMVKAWNYDPHTKTYDTKHGQTWLIATASDKRVGISVNRLLDDKHSYKTQKVILFEKEGE